MNRQPDMLGGGFGGFRGQLTRAGRLLVIYYAASLVLGLLVTHWTVPPYNEVILNALLNPLGGDRFALWQVLTHLLVVYPSAQYLLGFGIQVLIFWLFAWQVELQVGTRVFCFLVLGIPLLTGILGLPFSYLPVFASPFAGYELWIDVLLVAFYMMNRHSVGNFMFIVPLKMEHMIYFIVGLQILFFLARANPQLMYHLIAMGLTWLFFRFWLTQGSSGSAGRRASSSGKRRPPNIIVLPGGNDRNDPPLYH